MLGEVPFALLRYRLARPKDEKRLNTQMVMIG